MKVPRISGVCKMMSSKVNGIGRKHCDISLERCKRVASSSDSSRLRVTKERELQGLLEEFLVHKVSVAGISNIAESRSPRRRFIWILGVLACTLFMGYMTLKVILEYRKYPKNLVKEDFILPKVTFPAITICSLNPISSHHLQETSLRKFSELKKMMKEEASFQTFDIAVRDKCYAKPLCKWSWFEEQCYCVENPCLTESCMAENNTHCTCSSSFCNSRVRNVRTCRNATAGAYNWRTCQCEGTSTHGSDSERIEEENVDELLDSIGNSQVREVVRIIKKSKTYDLMGVEEALMPSAHELYEYGTTFDSLVSACSFEENNCHRENFTVLYHPTYGKCFMFNYVGFGNDVEKPIEIRSYGSTSGLQLLLRVTDRNALDLFRREIGARIVIHDPHMLPFVAEYGVNVRPRDMTTFEVSLSNIHRLSDPWGNCEDENKRMGNGDPYSILGCEKYCGYKQMTARCNCTMRHFLRGSVLNRRQPLFPLCNFSDEVQRKCSNKVSLEIEQRTECVCQPSCRETVYSYAVTASELNENYFRTVKAIRTLKLDSKGNKKYINYTDDKSMVGVKVYYNVFQVSNYKEIPSYSWETLVANIGGNFGFFMGLTLVTFLEIAEFFWDCIATIFIRRVDTVPNSQVVYAARNLIVSKQNENKKKNFSAQMLLDTAKRRRSL